MNQLVWVVYDVSKDRTRTKVAKECQRQGLYRVQKSVFLGKMPTSRMDELVLVSERLLDADTDSMYVFPLCEADFTKVRLIGRSFDQALVQDKLKALVI